MTLVSVSEQERIQGGLRAAEECFDILFDRAPVMMHSIDSDGRLVKVNSRWLQRLGYQRDEVLGRKSVEFLTEESRRQAIKDTLPLFWRVGSARGVGYQFVMKNGQVIDVLLDAEVTPEISGQSFTIAALREGHDLIQQQQSATTIKALQELTSWQHELKDFLSPQEIHNQDAGLLTPQDSSANALAKAGETLGTFLELTENISVSLRALLQTHEEMLDASVEQQRELLEVAKSMEKSCRPSAIMGHI